MKEEKEEKEMKEIKEEKELKELKEKIYKFFEYYKTNWILRVSIFGSKSKNRLGKKYYYDLKREKIEDMKLYSLNNKESKVEDIDIFIVGYNVDYSMKELLKIELSRLFGIKVDLFFLDYEKFIYQKEHGKLSSLMRHIS